MSKASLYDWDCVDWTNQDIIISRYLGCSKERVRQVRFLLKLPKAINHGRRTYKVPIRCIEEAERRKLPIERMTTGEIIKALGISKYTVHKHFPNRKPYGIRWDLISDETFKKTSDKQLAKKLGCSLNHIIHQRLKRRIYRKKPWQDWSKISTRELLTGNVQLITKKMNCCTSTVMYHVRKAKQTYGSIHHQSR